MSSILPLERHIGVRGGIRVQRARDTTAGHLRTLQVSLRGLMDQLSPEVPLIDPPVGDACLWIVPVALRSDRRCLRGELSGTAAICRTDPATG